jgi:hypothetical protein
MKNFKQFLTEREDLYKVTDDQLEKSLGHDHDVEITKKQREFIKNHFDKSPENKKNKSIVDTLNKSKDFLKVKHDISPEKK